MTLRALMVDVDGVVMVPQPGGWAASLERDLGLSIDVLQAEFFKPHWAEVVTGRAGLYERLGPVLAEHAPHLTCERLCAYWFERDSRLDHALLEDLAGLRAEGLALHLATVQEHLRAEHIWTGLGLRERFDAIHYSAAYGCGKPDPAFFAAVAARTGLAPSEMLLLDDRAENVVAARAAGWNAALWTGRERVRDLLSL